MTDGVRWLLCGVASLIFIAPARAETITRIWLTHAENTPATLTVNWETPAPGPSRVDYGASEALGSTVESGEAVTLHHVAIPFPAEGVLYYRVQSAGAQSAIHTVDSYSGETLRVAVAADWQEKPPLDALLADRPHLLVSCGDQIRGIMRFDRPGDPAYTAPFSALIDAYPALFARTPFMPLLGNHDRQLFPRMRKPPPTPLYDVEATAFRRFFPLPEPGWRWHFDVPAFGLRLIALDLNHTADAGTTWQSCHPFDAGSEQFVWYRDLMAQSDQPFVLTLYNEWHHLMNMIAERSWMPVIQQGSAAISGFGLFAERAEYGGLPCFNTALQTAEVFGNGAHTKFVRKVPSYLLITIPKSGGPMRVEIKDLRGDVMDSSEWPARTRKTE